ncbi:MAG: TraR/DksA C4-type zinc finger protein [Chloroflexi bacterium]|nr:TraR/DksA C4-type zinc finger protein [Chloroflexota bacterium]
MRSLQELLKVSNTLHGHLCPGQILGVRMAILGCRLVAVDEPTSSRDLIVYVEIDRCAADAVQAVTGCKLGKRTLKYFDYGKVAATFFNVATGKAFRVVARDDARESAWHYAPAGADKKAAQLHAYQDMPDEELFNVMSVDIELSPFDMPGRPISRVPCDDCGEGVNDGREIRSGQKLLCHACAEGAYYRVVEDALAL